MKTNESTNACPKCGVPVPAEAPQGLCPKCVFVQAVAPEAAPTATANIPSLERLAVAFPQLQIIELIGRGGMGFVFKARQPHLDRFVALKLLPDSLAHDPQFAERFNREGRVLARLNHPNIVSIFDFGQAGGFYYLMMEYVDGVNLRQAMQAGRFSPAEALTIVPKICEALQFAHEEGILHRDIKPENILLDAKGRVKIADFGIAKLVGEEHPDVSLTATGAALGTMHYMAPEQIEKPSTVDHRADIYSLGVVFYELLTGELPLGRFGPPSAKTPVDSRVDDVVMRTLEKEREKRFQSAGEMKTNVEHLTEVGAGTYKGVPPRTDGARPERGPHGTMVINPSAVISPVPKWSLKSVCAAVLTGLSLPVPMLFVVLLYLSRGNLGGWVILGGFVAILPGLAGTILGWMALSDIRGHEGKLRGLPLAVFGALTLPLLLLVGGTLGIVSIIVYRATAGLSMPFGALLILAVLAGVITFAVWAIHAAGRWGSNRPVSQRRGVLKWVFLALLVCGVGLILLPRVSSKSLAKKPAGFTETNTTPWIRFTFTAVELLEAKGVRWLAIDYLDDVHGESQKSFPWETTIPGFKAETRTTEFFKEAKDSSPAVRHQRVEYRMPDSAPREQIDRLRVNLEKALKHKSFRLELAESQAPLLLFELPGVEGGSFKAWVKVIPPLKLPAQSGSPEYLKAAAQVEDLQKEERELLQRYSSRHPVVLRKRDQIEAAQQEKARLERTSLTEPGANSLMLQFRLVADEADTIAPVDVMIESRDNGATVPRRVLRTVLLDGSAVARAGIVLETNSHRTIGVELTAEGARQFGAITVANINRQLAIVAGGRVLSAPIIRSPIHGGELQISGNMSSAEVHKLVAELNRKPAGLEFSPTVERSLPRAPEFPPGAICLDLESGTFMTNRTFRADQRGMRDWLQTSGVDLVAIGAADQIPVISAYDLAFVEAPTNAWDSLPPQEVGWNWTLMRDAAKQESHLATMPGRPDTFLFRTRENGFGLLQILYATNPAPVVKIRYKLVKDAPAKLF